MSNWLFKHINNDNADPALIMGEQTLSYRELNDKIESVAHQLLAGAADLNEKTIAMYLPASFDYVIALHGIWRSGGIAVPLNINCVLSELEYYLTTAQVEIFISAEEYLDDLLPLVAGLSIEIITIEQLLVADALSSVHRVRQLPMIDEQRRGMILFTSGTTNKPKGVVNTHGNLAAQINTLLDAWQWSDQDVIPLFLPLHHVHGIVNVLSCALAAGAQVYVYASFDMPTIAAEVAADTFSVFMAVPTIYVRFLQYIDTLAMSDKQQLIAGFSQMRLNVSGSAACPVDVFNRWQELTGQVLLERYGMTEVGMALSNPYRGERRAGHVGQALPGVTVALFNEQEQMITEDQEAGEIRLKSPSVFAEYWKNPQATQSSFIDGWFCTGDVAVLVDGYYKIMGRASIDIIKSGGYKLSALEIEDVLLLHPSIKEVAVIGVDDQEWGERVVAVTVLNQHTQLSLSQLKDWCRDRLSAYKIPKQLRVMLSLPRNAMGKVIKPQLRTLVSDSGSQ